MRIFVWIYGIFFLFWGIAGFIPGWVQNGALFEIFAVNITLNVCYIATALLAFGLGIWSLACARAFFKIIALSYSLWAFLGFIYEKKEIFDLVANNGPNTWLHVIAAIIALILGFGAKD